MTPEERTRQLAARCRVEWKRLGPDGREVLAPQIGRR
jgi:hypothetical protein